MEVQHGSPSASGLNVALNTHGVADGMQGARPDHHRVGAEVCGDGVPGAVRLAIPRVEDVGDADPHRVGKTLLAVGREDLVPVTQCQPRTGLSGLLAHVWGPEAELSVTLQSGALDVETPNHGHHLEGLDEVLVAQLDREVRMGGEASLVVEDPHHCRIRTIDGMVCCRRDEWVRIALVGTDVLGHIFLLVECSVLHSGRRLAQFQTELTAP